jgi:hypothetical protein
MKSATDKTVIIRCGNHWLLTDDTRTKAEWVSDRALASRHTPKWAARFAVDHLKQFNSRVEVFTIHAAQQLADRERHDRLRSTYFYAVEAEVRRLAPRIDFYIRGVGCPAYCFAVDTNFEAGIPATKAARAFLKNYKRRKGIKA